MIRPPGWRGRDRTAPPAAPRRTPPAAPSRRRSATAEKGVLVSGHSKWATIKHKKGKDGRQARQALLEALAGDHGGRPEGGPDPDMNVALANAIEKARGYSMPKDNIERAIQRGAGGGERRAVRERSSTRATARPASPSSSRCSPTTATAPRPRCATSSPSTAARWRSRAPSPGCSSAAVRSSSTATKFDEDDVMTAAIEAGAEDVVAGRRPVRGPHRAGRPRRRCATPSRPPASSSSRPSSRWSRRTPSSSRRTTRARP